MTDLDPAPLHRSTEIKDLTHLTEKDKEHIAEDVQTRDSSIHRSPVVEDLAHVSLQDADKLLAADETK
ncbi:unnamed protein product [Adineta ricciae]|uniref:Uncharacterized protein n=1 Tax=Adineta ricciae TaxID=249248 RepID=A0A813WVM3_ADIRI|nr:unnamed protein product [Adineta ricciae]CAF1325332.1 unnamed protein product [Adineta ricciae]